MARRRLSPNHAYPPAPRSRVKIPAAEAQVKMHRPTLLRLREMIREHEEESYPWQSDMRPNGDSKAYLAAKSVARELGLPLQFETDLTKHDREMMNRHPEEDFFWAIGEGGTFLALNNSLSFSQAKGVLESLEKMFPYFYIIDSEGEVFEVDSVDAIEFLSGTEMTKNASKKPDERAAQELILFIENDSRLWGPNSQGASIRKNIASKIKSDTLDPEKLPKLFGYLIESGAKLYAKEYARASEWNTIFDAATRRYASEVMADSYLEELEVQGEYAPNGKGHNGYPSWNAWNVSLWINNDEGLYNEAKRCVRRARTRKEAAEMMLETLSEAIGENPKTPDGAPYSVSSIIGAMRGL